MDYKKEEIKEYFDTLRKEEEEYHLENYSQEERNEDWKRDLHHTIFNERYYIIGTHQAKQWLGNMAFDVINFIKDYEQDNFGQVLTDLSEPEKVVNMYTYIIGEEIVADYFKELEEAEA